MASRLLRSTSPEVTQRLNALQREVTFEPKIEAETRSKSSQGRFEGQGHSIEKLTGNEENLAKEFEALAREWQQQQQQNAAVDNDNDDVLDLEQLTNDISEV